MSLLRVTNSNKNVEEKVNYFIARFDHFLSNAGGEPSFEIETQLSLFEKVLFQIKNNSDSYKITYINLYFKSPLLDYPDLWANYKLFKQVKKFIDDYNLLVDPKSSQNQIKDAKLKILDSSKFQDLLDKLIAELKHKMPSSLGEDLLSVIQCKYSLLEDDHIMKLDLLAKLFVSGGFFSGKTSEEIRTVISRVFAKDIGFPFPPNIKTKRQKRDYIDAGLLSNQLNGFTTLLREDHNQGIVMMKLFGIEFPSDFEFEYDGVMFLGINHPKVIKTQLGILESNEGLSDKILKGVFDPDEYIYICTHLKWFSTESIFQKMAVATKNQINYFSSIVRSEFVLDHTRNYILVNKQWNRIGFRLSPVRRKKVDVYMIEDLKNNMMTLLKKEKQSESGNWFLRMEPLFINANKFLIMSDFWIYLEALLPPAKLELIQVSLKELVSTVILLNEKQVQQDRIIYSFLLHFSGHDGRDMLGLNYAQWQSAIAKLQRKKIPKEIRELKDPFITELLKEFDTILNKGYFLNAKDYYSSILTEAYGNRNSSVHQGFSDNVLIVKLEKTLPYLIQRLRWIIADEIRIHPKLSFDLLLENLLTQSRLLLTLYNSSPFKNRS